MKSPIETERVPSLRACAQTDSREITKEHLWDVRFGQDVLSCYDGVLGLSPFTRRGAKYLKE